MSLRLSGRVARLAFITAAASALSVGVASAQGPYGQGAYAPDYGPGYGQGYGPGAYAGDDDRSPAYPTPPRGYAPAPNDGYAPGPYVAAPYAGAPYAPAPYASAPYARAPFVGGPYDSYAAQRRAWRRRQAEQQQMAYAPPPTAPYAQPAAAQAATDETAAPASGQASGQPQTVGAVAATAPSTAPAQPAAPQSVALAHKIVEKASAIAAAFTDGASVAKAVKTGAAYEPIQFEEGAIAYAAIVALQEPAFVEGVRAAAGDDPDRVQQIATGLMANPGSALTFPGADAAAARASAALRRQGGRLMEAGLKVKQSAYDVQHAEWSKGDILDPEARLAGAKTLSATRLTPERDETDRLLKLVLAEQGAPAEPGEGAASPVVGRGLALAALAVLGQAGEGGAETLRPLLAEKKDGECLKMAKLNLFQCLAVAGPHYEDIFCLGQHAMMDTAQCVIAASGVSHPVMTASAAKVEAAAPAAATDVTPTPQDYWVPLSSRADEAARK
jgi:hypothetical protein